MLRVLVLALLILGTSGSLSEAACTKGVDCRCDLLAATSGLLMCRDWEEPTLYSTTGVGGVSPYYGPWFDGSKLGPCTAYGTYPRGCNSFWGQTFGQGNTSSATWQNGQPASPTFGSACSNFGGNCYVGAYRAGDAWQANSFAKMGIFRVAEFTDEIGTLTVPTNTVSGTAGPFDGIQSLAYRVMTGDSGGILGAYNFAATLHLGITYALSYASNVVASNIFTQPWKHSEWRQPHNTTAGFDGLAGYTVASVSAPNLDEYFPFYGFITFDQNLAVGTATTRCNNGIAAATITKGTVFCDGSAYMKFQSNNTAVYQRSRDFPFATWGCLRMEWDLSTPSAAHTVWKFQGPGMSGEVTVLDISNLDTTMTGAGCAGCTGWDQYVPNAYANQNIASTTAVNTFRYEDNMVVVNGAPVSCSQIGFGAGAAPGKSGPSFFAQRSAE